MPPITAIFTPEPHCFYRCLFSPPLRSLLHTLPIYYTLTCLQTCIIRSPIVHDDQWGWCRHDRKTWTNPHPHTLNITRVYDMAELTPIQIWLATTHTMCYIHIWSDAPYLESMVVDASYYCRIERRPAQIDDRLLTHTRTHTMIVEKASCEIALMPLTLKDL